MKITFVVSQYNRISGGNRALFEYSNRLKDRGHEVSWYVIAKPARWYRVDHWKRIITKKIGRNDACPCGSGKKYKMCHGA